MNNFSIKKIDKISIEIPYDLINNIPETNLSYTIGRTRSSLSQTIILTFTNQKDRDELYDLLIETTIK